MKMTMHLHCSVADCANGLTELPDIGPVIHYNGPVKLATFPGPGHFLPDMSGGPALFAQSVSVDGS